MKRSESLRDLWRLAMAVFFVSASVSVSGCGRPDASGEPSAPNSISLLPTASLETATPLSQPASGGSPVVTAEFSSGELSPASQGTAIEATAFETPATRQAAPAVLPATEEPRRSKAESAPTPPAQTGHGGSSTVPPGSGAKASVADSEPLFVNWPQPKLVLVFTGRQDGYLEPCGCSGLENQKGGMVRRNTLLKQLAAKGWPVVPIDAGNQVRRFGRQSEIKFQITVEGLKTMGYRAIAFGPDDLRLASELVGVIAPSGDEPSAFVCANVTVFDESFTSPFLVIEAAGRKIGVTSVLGQRNQNQINNSYITMRPAEEGLAAVWPKLQQARCDLYVLIAHASMEESRVLAQKFPQFPLVVTTGGAGEPTMEPEKIEGTHSQMIQVGTKGMYAGVVALSDDPTQPLRYQRVPLDARFPDSDDMLQLLAAYQDQLQEAGLEGLGIRPQPYPLTGDPALAKKTLHAGEFIGSESCAECHENAWNVWKNGLDGNPPKHSLAYATLQQPPKRAKVPRNFDPECLSCHVVGWNPQKYFPYKSGFMSLEGTPELINVGCENCHGPGAAHVAAENGDEELDEETIAKLREEQVLTLKNAEQKCLECHDLDNSPAFQEEGAFQRYWEKIKHSKSLDGKTPDGKSADSKSADSKSADSKTPASK
ncbi:MAG: multiheme c-type cytochrome [Pirellulaceae bacterium]